MKEKVRRNVFANTIGILVIYIYHIFLRIYFLYSVFTKGMYIPYDLLQDYKNAGISSENIQSSSHLGTILGVLLLLVNLLIFWLLIRNAIALAKNTKVSKNLYLAVALLNAVPALLFLSGGGLTLSFILQAFVTGLSLFNYFTIGKEEKKTLQK